MEFDDLTIKVYQQFNLASVIPQSVYRALKKKECQWSEINPNITDNQNVSKLLLMFWLLYFF